MYQRGLHNGILQDQEPGTGKTGLGKPRATLNGRLTCACPESKPEAEHDAENYTQLL
jgi:hypothetical protein